METKELIKNYSGKATYQFVVRGKVDPDFISRRYALSVRHTKAKDQILSTLTGEMNDQEALSGIINILIDNRYIAVSVMKIKDIKIKQTVMGGMTTYMAE